MSFLKGGVNSARGGSARNFMGIPKWLKNTYFWLKAQEGPRRFCEGDWGELIRRRGCRRVFYMILQL